MVDPSSSLTAATLPPEPASKFFMETPWTTIKQVKKVRLYGCNQMKLFTSKTDTNFTQIMHVCVCVCVCVRVCVCVEREREYL